MTQTAIVPAEETSAISRWEALAHDIAIASEQAEAKVFDYRSEYDNKAARSWVAQLRRLKGSIERARKDAKAVHLQRGREVDETAKTLESAVAALIEPHQLALDAIVAEEQARIHGHQMVLQRIQQLTENIIDSATADARLAELRTIDTSGLEEFRAAGEARHADAEALLLELGDRLRQQEADQRELEALRAERAAREEEERRERDRQAAIAEERRRQEAERQAAAEAAARREAEQRAQLEAAQRAAAEAEQRAAAAAAREQARLDAERERLAREDEARRTRQTALEAQLLEVLRPLNRQQVAAAIASGTLHPAVAIDWSRVG